MKQLPLFHIALLLAGVLFVQASRAEDYTRWGLPDGALARLGKGHFRVDGGAASPDRTRLAVASNIGIWVYTHTGTEVALITNAVGFELVSFSPDGQTLASGSRDATFRLWDVASGKEKSEPPKKKLKDRVWIGAAPAMVGGFFAVYNQKCALDGPSSDFFGGVTYEYEAIEKDGKCYVGGTYGQRLSDGSFVNDGERLELKESYWNAAKSRDTTVKEGFGHFPTAVRFSGAP